MKNFPVVDKKEEILPAIIAIIVFVSISFVVGFQFSESKHKKELEQLRLDKECLEFQLETTIESMHLQNYHMGKHYIECNFDDKYRIK